MYEENGQKTPRHLLVFGGEAIVTGCGWSTTRGLGSPPGTGLAVALTPWFMDDSAVKISFLLDTVIKSRS